MVNGKGQYVQVKVGQEITVLIENDEKAFYTIAVAVQETGTDG